MKKFLKFLLWLVGLMVVAGVAAYAYYGGFRTVSFEAVTLGGETMVYRHMTGDYALSGAVMDEVCNALKEKYGVATAKGYGTYYDNPNTTSKENLRYDAGCIVESTDSVTLAAVQNEFAVKVFPVGSYLFTSFPYRGRMSILVALTKVYPSLYKYMSDQGLAERLGSITEIYDVSGERIEYRVELLGETGNVE